MDDLSSRISRIAIKGEEGEGRTAQQLLQVDCDCDLEFGASDSTSLTLTTTTSASSILTTPSLLTTPKDERTHTHTGNEGGSSSSNNNDESSSEWKILYDRLNRTPPKATRTAQFQDTLKTAEDLLKLSNDPDFQDKSFHDLTYDQQAILMLMIMKGMDKIFAASIEMNAKVLIKALHPESEEYQRMMSFVRQGGDRDYRGAPDLLQLEVVNDIRKFQESASNAITIFTGRPALTPFLYFQNENSYVCAYSAAAGLLYYSSHNNEESGENAFKMNISRYIRDEVPGLEIANFTLTTVKGAYLERVLLGLMKSFGTAECNWLPVG
jgi:hypothetical protein